MPDYIIQKAVSPDKVVKKNRKSLAEYGQQFDAFKKYDGCCAILTGTQTLSRTGEVYRCLDEHPLQDICRVYGLAIIGEAWWPGKDQFNLISGEFRRMQVSDRLQVAVHDVLLLDELEAGYSCVPFWQRMARLPDIYGDRWFKAEAWEAGTYGDPQALCNRLVELGGYDGLVLRDPEGTWTVGSGTTGEIVKIKRVLSFDLRCIGHEEGQGKHAGRMGALLLSFNGKTLRVGTGFTDEQRENTAQFYGAICEVEAMDYSSDGLLREPRFKGIRFDKAAADA